MNIKSLFLRLPPTKATFCLGCYNAVRTNIMIPALCAHVSQQTGTHGDSEKGESHTASVHKHTIAKQIFLQIQAVLQSIKVVPKSRFIRIKC